MNVLYIVSVQLHCHLNFLTLYSHFLSLCLSVCLSVCLSGCLAGDRPQR